MNRTEPYLICKGCGVILENPLRYYIIKCVNCSSEDLDIHEEPKDE